MTRKSVAVRVSEGVDYVRKEYGNGWFRHVNLDTFDMANGGKCLLSQLESHRAGVTKYYPDVRQTLGMSIESGADYGFDTYGYGGPTDTFPALTREWRKRITHLRAVWPEPAPTIDPEGITGEPFVNLFVTVTGHDSPLTFKEVTGVRYREGLLTFEDKAENLYTVPNALHWHNTVTDD